MDFEHVVLGKAEPSLSINLSKNPPKEKDILSPGSKHPLIEKYLKQLRYCPGPARQ